MSSRIAQIGLSAPVREYATGAAQDAIATLEVANFLAPTVNVTLPRFTFKVFDHQNKFRIPDAARAVGGAATQVKIGGTDETGILKPYALDTPLDEFEFASDGSGMTDAEITGIFQDAADIGAQVGALSWANTVVSGALTAAGSGTDKNSATTTLDLIDAIDEQILAVAKASKCGQLCPVKIIMGPTAFRRIKNHPLTRARFNLGSKGGGKGAANENSVNPNVSDIMGLFINNAPTKLSWITYDSADEGATEAPTFLLDDAVLIFAGADNPTRVDPSFMKTFRLRNAFMKPGEYTSADGRQKVFKMDWYALAKVTNSAAVARLNITAS